MLGEGDSSLANIHVQETDEPATAHLNKYGKQYDPDVFASPLYVDLMLAQGCSQITICRSIAMPRSFTVSALREAGFSPLEG